MEWLNYHHLLYFWAVARRGGIVQAAEELNVAQPTISGQIKDLEEALGEQLFRRTGRGLVLTETGQMVFEYADEIFSIGRDLMDAVRSRPIGRPVRLAVGVTDAIPKTLSRVLLEPALTSEPAVRLSVHEHDLDKMLRELATYRLDLVISERPASPTRSPCYSQELADSDVSFYGTAEMAERYRVDFPRSLHAAPVFLPTENLALRRSLDQFFDESGIQPKVRGEFEDPALTVSFAQAGLGMYPSATLIEPELRRLSNLVPVGRIESVRERYFAITVKRKLPHPVVASILAHAKRAFGDYAPLPVSE